MIDRLVFDSPPYRWKKLHAGENPTVIMHFSTGGTGQNPSVRTAALGPLRGASMEIHDRRILDAVLPIALDEREEEALRLSAMTVLGSYRITGARTGEGGWVRGDEITVPSVAP